MGKSGRRRGRSSVPGGGVGAVGLVVVVAAVVLLLQLAACDGFLAPSSVAKGGGRGRYPSLLTAAAASSKKGGGSKKKKGGGAGKISVKGFNSAPATSKGTRKGAEMGQLLRDERSEELLKWMSQRGAEVKRIALADFGGLRGVMALQDIAQGQSIIEIPAQMALDLGEGSADPTRPALELLKLWSEGEASRSKPYLDSLPQPGSSDLTTTDFFTQEELDMLQWPPLAEETRKRTRLCEDLYEDVVKTQLAMGTFGSVDVTLDDLKWAVFIVVSRVLTVQRDDGFSAAKLLIPGIDMFNHNASSPHILTGVASPGRMLKILAGKPIPMGSQINIAYSAGKPRSDRFLADYGFLDPLGCMPQDKEMLKAAPQSALDALCLSTLDADRQLLSKPSSLRSPREELAVQFRAHLKEILSSS